MISWCVSQYAAVGFADRWRHCHRVLLQNDDEGLVSGNREGTRTICQTLSSSDNTFVYFNEIIRYNYSCRAVYVLKGFRIVTIGEINTVSVDGPYIIISHQCDSSLLDSVPTPWKTTDMCLYNMDLLPLMLMFYRTLNNQPFKKLDCWSSAIVWRYCLGPWSSTGTFSTLGTH